MPTKVVSAVHGWTSEDYTMVPSVKEFKALQAEIRELRREIAAMKSSGSALERSVKSMQGSVTPLKNSMRTLKGDIFKELTDGEWKKILQREVHIATQQLEASMNCVSAAGASRISEGISVGMHKKTAQKPVARKKAVRENSDVVGEVIPQKKEGVKSKKKSKKK